MNFWESSYQHEDLMIGESNEAIGSYIFKSNSLCMFSNDGQLLKIVIREGEGGQKSSSILREDEPILSHKVD
jgi:hypothetical protein